MRKNRFATEEARKREYEQQKEYFKREREQIKLAMSRKQAKQLRDFCKYIGLPVQTFIKNCIAIEISFRDGEFDWEIKDM